MRLPNLLGTPRGRLIAFFALYVAEGIPYGLTNTAVATQMRRQGLDPAAIGTFTAALYLPWAIKWVAGPVVDVISSDRFGRRRTWILLTQFFMVATLIAAVPVSFRDQLALFTTILIVHNVFSATQDVAIDALAVGTLGDHERGLANGMMFSGQYLGQAIGGAGVLFLVPYVGLTPSFLMVAAVISLITLLVALPMREPPGAPRLRAAGSRLRAVGRELQAFTVEAARSFVATRGAFVAVFISLLPIGAYAMGLAMQTVIAVELGLDDRRVATLALGSTLLTALFCPLGGWLSDRYGRRRMVALFVLGMGIATVALALGMKQWGWIMPVSPTLADRPVPPPALVSWFWWLVWIYSVFQGLMYGSSTALAMDVTNPRVAATQFTAYMAMSNLAIAYSSQWQGVAAVRWGYPTMLAIDAALGMVCVLLMPLMGKVLTRGGPPPPGAAIPEAAR